jgi:hypothetical protein
LELIGRVAQNGPIPTQLLVGTISSEAFFFFALNAESLAWVDSRESTTLDMKKNIELGLFTRNCHPPNPWTESLPLT